MIYQFKSGSRFSGDAKAIYGEIEAIGEYRTPRQVWKKAKAKSSAMHGCFTWDRDEAAENWWTQEARQLMAAIVICDDQSEEEPMKLIGRALENVTIDGEKGLRGYVTREQVIRTPDWLDEVRNEIRAAIDELDRKLKTFEGVEEIGKAVSGIRRRLKSAKELVSA